MIVLILCQCVSNSVLINGTAKQSWMREINSVSHLINLPDNLAPSFGKPLTNTLPLAVRIPHSFRTGHVSQKNRLVVTINWTSFWSLKIDNSSRTSS